MEKLNFIKNKFKNFDEEFYSDLVEHSILTTVELKQELTREGQKVNYIPILISGIVKVYSLNDGKELLYYYIEPSESCIMTFSSIFSDRISKIYAISEERSEVLLLPVSPFLTWLIKYPRLNQFFLWNMIFGIRL